FVLFFLYNRKYKLTDIVVLCFFFFKQKTAYEITRRDWSSDVCSSDLPFRYPPALYARKVQGNVTLRLFIDRDGRPKNDSTRVEESSGLESLDSAAVRGSQELRFVPAKLHGEPMAVSVLFPV